jgi:AbrB family looped-hinge helix DNA binding protein
METVKLSSKGQILIPKEIRAAHKLTPGTQFLISFVGG